MYPCEQQSSGNSFPRGLARVKQLISFKKEAGRGFVSWLLVKVGGGGETSQKLVVALGLPSAGHGSAATAHIPPVLVGHRDATASAHSWREREENKNKKHSSVFPADRSLNTGWELGSGPCVKFSSACLETAALLPEHPTSISVIAGGIRPTCQACCYLCKRSVPEGSLKNKSPFYSALDAGSEPAN